MASLKTCGFVALDGMDPRDAQQLMERLQGKILGVKFNDLLDGHDVEMLTCANYNGLVAWADAKLHDIPATVKNRASRLTNFGAEIITVHASGDTDMVKAAVEAYLSLRPTGTLGIAAVTVLTSLSYAACKRIFGGEPLITAYNLGEIALLGGAFGLVCSPLEVKMLKENFPHLKLLVPGIRSAGVEAHDQVRISTPAVALENGADYLVIGREITQAPDPLGAIARIEESIAHLP